MAVYITHASIDENGKITGGAAGDQTGKEVCTRTWYSKPWSVMLRHPDAALAAKAAEIAVKLAKSNLVGYDQGGRNTLYQALKGCNFNVSTYISSGKKTETDCSAFVYACWCCVLPALRSDSNAPTTSTMRAAMTKAGFVAYTASKYVSQWGSLLAGDLLVKPGSHVVMVTTGAAASSATATTGSKGSCAVTLPVLAQGSTGNSVRAMQRLLIAAGYSCGSAGADGDFGSGTLAALKKFQGGKGLTADGECGKNTWGKLLT